MSSRTHKSRLRDALRLRAVPWATQHLGWAPLPPTRSLLGQRAYLLQQLHINRVFDVGANEGQYALELRRTGYKGHIHSFEPASEPFGRLSSATAGDADWTAENVALSEHSGRGTINTWSGAGSTVSSLLAPSAGLVAHMGAEPRVEAVSVATLQEWVTHRAIDVRHTLLKIDVQGSEAAVLRGAGPLLADFAAVEFEAPLSEWYEGEASLGALLGLLRANAQVPVSIMTERFTREWLGAVDVDVLAIRSDLVRFPSVDH